MAHKDEMTPDETPRGEDTPLARACLDNLKEALARRTVEAKAELANIVRIAIEDRGALLSYLQCTEDYPASKETADPAAGVAEGDATERESSFFQKSPMPDALPPERLEPVPEEMWEALWGLEPRHAAAREEIDAVDIIHSLQGGTAIEKILAKISPHTTQEILLFLQKFYTQALYLNRLCSQSEIRQNISQTDNFRRQVEQMTDLFDAIIVLLMQKIDTPASQASSVAAHSGAPQTETHASIPHMNPLIREDGPPYE